MELTDKYFHSVHSYDIPYDDTLENIEMRLEKLSRILESGAILCKENIVSRYGSGNFHSNTSINGELFVSISRYQDSGTAYDKQYKEECAPEYFEDAFLDFVLQQFSIILDSSIEKDLKLYEGGIYLERQILREIPLKYMVGISVFDGGELYPFFHSVAEEKFPLFYQNGFSCYELFSILDLLEQHHYSVPVVSILDGNSYQDNIQYKKFITSNREKEVSYRY